MNGFVDLCPSLHHRSPGAVSELGEEGVPSPASTDGFFDAPRRNKNPRARSALALNERRERATGSKNLPGSSSMPKSAMSSKTGKKKASVNVVKYVLDDDDDDDLNDGPFTTNDGSKGVQYKEDDVQRKRADSGDDDDDDDGEVKEKKMSRMYSKSNLSKSASKAASKFLETLKGPSKASLEGVKSSDNFHADKAKGASLFFGVCWFVLDLIAHVLLLAGVMGLLWWGFSLLPIASAEHEYYQHPIINSAYVSLTMLLCYAWPVITIYMIVGFKHKEQFWKSVRRTILPFAIMAMTYRWILNNWLGFPTAYYMMSYLFGYIGFLLGTWTFSKSFFRAIDMPHLVQPSAFTFAAPSFAYSVYAIYIMDLGADSNSDIARAFVRLVVHPAIVEIVFIILRYNARKFKGTDVESAWLLVAFPIFISSLLGRLLLTNMSSATSAFLLSVALSFQEAIARLTVGWRDRHLLWLLHGKEGAKVLKTLRGVHFRASSYTVEMLSESISICLAPTLYYVFHPHRLVWNFNYQPDMTPTLARLFSDVGSQLSLEVVTDFVGTYSEVFWHSIPVIEIGWKRRMASWNGWRTYIYICMYFVFLTSVYAASFKRTTATVLRCSSPDPCTCEGGRYLINLLYCAGEDY